MAEYEIEHGIPVPLSNNEQPDRSKYPFKRMKVGDSFSFAAVDVTKIKGAAHAFVSYTELGKGRQFITAPDGDRLRIWRIK